MKTNYFSWRLWTILTVVFFISLMDAIAGFAAVVDNASVNFSTIGTWGTSSFSPGYYGSNYRYSSPGTGTRQAAWTFSVIAGQYKISAQWAPAENRATNATYRIYNNDVEIGFQTFDQTASGGQFNSFDVNYTLADGTLEVVLTDDADGYVVADAIEIVYLGSGGNLAPDGAIDTPISNLAIMVGDTVNFSGTAIDPDNTLPLNYLWSFGSGSGVPDMDVEDPGAVVFNNAGVFTVAFMVTDGDGLSDPIPPTVKITVNEPSTEIIIDNTDSAFSDTGNWGASSFTPGYYGTGYRYTAAGGGSREAKWSFPVTAGQYQLYAQWAAFENRASNASFFVYNNGLEIGFQEFDQRFDGGQFNPFDSVYDVQAGTLDVVLSDQADGYVIADAVKALYLGSSGNLSPDGVIDTPSGAVSIAPGESVNFTGTGTDPDGDLPLSHVWNFGTAGIADAAVEDPGDVVFTVEGTHTVTYTVTDAQGLSDPSPATVQVTVLDSSPTIVDNLDQNFSTVGSWGRSSFLPGERYGDDYRYAAAGTGARQAIWTFSVSSGQYNLSAWWASFDNRASNATYLIYNNDVLIGTQVFDQRVNGGVFNPFDSTFQLTDGTLDIVLTDNADGYVIADAVQINFLGSGGNFAPSGIIETPSATETIPLGGSLDFTGSASDPDGDLPLTYLWSFGEGSGISESTVEDPGVVIFNNVGEFTVTFTVTDSLGLSDPTPATVLVNVVSSGMESVVVDNTDAGFQTVGSWGTSSFTPGYYGTDYRYIDVSPGVNSAQWEANLLEGRYDVSARWSAEANRASRAKYTILNNGTALRTYWADQRNDGGEFNSLGVFYLEGGLQTIVLSEIFKMDGVIIADAVKFENLCQADPCVYVTAPQDYHIQASGVLSAAANIQTGNDISQYGVRFVLDEGTASEQAVVDLSAPFSADFSLTAPSAGEHRIDAYLTDVTGVPLGGLNGHDFALSIGIGKYMVAMGDSTTDGVGDDDISDDISQDMRNGGGGYPPVLNDFLTVAASGVPHTVVNEGVSGAVAADGAALVDSLLQKHPLAERFLIEYGINDSGAFPPVPSGLGLDSTDPDYPGTFKHSLQQIIDAVNLDGREACLAKAPIILGDGVDSDPYPDPDAGQRNIIIKEYNQVIDELVSDPANQITITPPDFYAKFNEVIDSETGQRRYEVEYSDNFHMNGDGYRTKAGEWQRVLSEN